MPKDKDDLKKIMQLLRGSRGAKVSSIEIEFEEPEGEDDMKEKVVNGIKKQRGKKK